VGPVTFDLTGPIHQDLLVEWFDARLAELDAVGVMKMLPGLGKGAMTIS